MRSALTSVLTILSLSTSAAAFPAAGISERSFTTDAAAVADKSFDFVIVGGGLAGLVVASRLSEWSNTTVLVIEAGADGTDVELRRTVPGFAYMRGLAFGTHYDWNYTTVEQFGPESSKAFPIGRGLGGGSAVNGMFWTRPGSAEFDAWSQLNNGSGWDWEDVDGYIKKAETITPASEENQKTFNIQNDPSAHGSSGPLKIGWSSYIYKMTEHWIPTWQKLGLPVRDLAAGDNRGAAIVPSTINSAIGSRSDSKSAYLTEERPNLIVLTGQQVTKIDFNGTVNGDVVASGVQFQSAADGKPISVKANKEVIVSSGAVGSPKVLQLSGIGPSSILTPLNVPVNVDLPVGYNFQDHVMVQLGFNGAPGTETWTPLCLSPELQEKALVEWQSSKSGPLTYVNEATAYASLKDAGASVSVDVDAAVKAHVEKYSIPESVQKGLAAQYAIMKGWLDSEIPQLEAIMNLWGPTAEGVRFEAAVQHPWSRGTVFISSASAFDMPKIDPNYLGLDVDMSLLTQGVDYIRKLAATDPLHTVVTDEVLPGANVTADALTAWIKSACGSEYHPIGTCPMLPRDMGGVVDTDLRVYGTLNVRVIDASVAPLQVSAHTMAPAYGIAEKGADLIKAFYSQPPSSTDSDKNTTVTTGGLPSAAATSGIKPNTNTKTGGAATFGVSWAALVGLLAIPAFL